VTGVQTCALPIFDGGGCVPGQRPIPADQLAAATNQKRTDALTGEQRGVAHRFRKFFRDALRGSKQTVEYHIELSGEPSEDIARRSRSAGLVGGWHDGDGASKAAQRTDQSVGSAVSLGIFLFRRTSASPAGLAFVGTIRCPLVLVSRSS